MSTKTVLQSLETRVENALAASGYPGVRANVHRSSHPEHGDYQADGLMAVAKANGIPPRQLAEAVLRRLDLGDEISHAEVAGPGFLNMIVSPDSLVRRIRAALRDPYLALPRVNDDAVERVVIDYSSPNLAKEMHVGHLRSTIIGDALTRILRFVGHTVIAQNHVGDWGTQFGMLSAHMSTCFRDERSDVLLRDLEVFYRNAKARFDTDARFAESARDYVVRLQQGDPVVRSIWKQFREISLSHCEEIYRELGVALTTEDVRGESAYNDDLPLIVSDLQKKGLAVASDGAQVVFLDGDDARKTGNHCTAYILQKRDGGYLYSTTDLAAIRYRVRELEANRVIYVVDARQSSHFTDLFSVARRAGYVTSDVQLDHVSFGVVLGENGRPLKTRNGGNVKLSDLISEATRRAYDVVASKNPGMKEHERNDIARTIGIGAVKYFDLARNRSTDYVFDWESMLSFDGNTGPYVQYAYSRTRSILRRAGAWDDTAPVRLSQRLERRLALNLVRFGDAVLAVARDSSPNHLCTYLYELAGSLMRFHEACPVLTSDEEVRDSRLTLCLLSAQTLQQGLNLLGIDVRERI
ncbi:arginine--tRNA ligase [Paraburkholderia terrae]|uniref:arginine--tRNA ligase n=1 Tax=Paraburkholderia terrae TaxID=311230 RepID=UPI00200B188F|nr:arginine--tRNA ligase [Paraburkholderia terrae]